MDSSTGYQGQFGKVAVWEFLKRDDWYEQVFYKHNDPRTESWFLLLTPEPVLCVVFAYLIFVVFAPKWMENRPAFNLRGLIVAYNFGLVFLSAYMSVEFFLTSYLLGYSYACQGMDWTYSTDPISMRLVSVQWWFFFSKIIELADTVFFILRKKNNQVTFLHVYHHATMILNWWAATKYIPIGQTFFVGMINSGIHALMYVYYGLSAVGPEMQKYLWWKKHMTTLQLIQFFAVISHTAYNKFVRTDCDFPFLYNTIVFYYAISMVVLFSDFYYRAYVRSRRSPRAKPTEEPRLNNNGYLPAEKQATYGVKPTHGREVRQNGDSELRTRRN